MASDSPAGRPAGRERSEVTTANQGPLTAVPGRPAAYIRVADAVTASDLRMLRQQHHVLATARKLGWPEPDVYIGTGPAGQPASNLPALTDAITSELYDAVIVYDLDRISPSADRLRAFTEDCRRHGVSLYLTTGERVGRA